MVQKLNVVMIQEMDAIRGLLLRLEEQHRCVVVSDIFGMEACVDKIKEANKNIAHMEVERRKLMQSRTMGSIVEEFKGVEFESNYNEIKNLLQEVILQKDTNELLIKQGLSFTNRILNILNPLRETTTYNAYGKVKK